MPMTFRKILVGLELTPAGTAIGEGSEHAVAQALDLAPRLGASVVLVHATAGNEHYDRSDDAQHDVWRHHEGLSAEGRQALDDVVTSFADAGVDVALELVRDRAHRAIIATAARSITCANSIQPRRRPNRAGRRGSGRRSTSGDQKNFSV